MAGRRWTAREETLLGKLYPQFILGKINSKDLSGVFNRTMGAVQIHAGKMGLTNVAYDEINQELLKELKKQGRLD